MLEKWLLSPKRVKRESEAWLIAKNAQICDWLPWIEHRHPRAAKEIAKRALILNALIQIHFKAPIPAIREWLHKNALADCLSDKERSLIKKTNEELTEQEIADLYWLIDSLYALMWVGLKYDELTPISDVPDTLSSLLPSIQQGESAQSFIQSFHIRPYQQCFRMLDLFYRAHWYAREGHLTNISTQPFFLDPIMERRRALEWYIETTTDWDNIEMST